MYDAVLLPTDGGEHASAAADHALDLAGRYGTTLHAPFVVDTETNALTVSNLVRPVPAGSGRGLAGYLDGENGIRVGALAGSVASLPPTAVGFFVTNVTLGYGSAGPFPGGVAVPFFASTLSTVGLGALGGALSGRVVDAVGG